MRLVERLPRAAMVAAFVCSGNATGSGISFEALATASLHLVSPSPEYRTGARFSMDAGRLALLAVGDFPPGIGASSNTVAAALVGWNALDTSLIKLRILGGLNYRVSGTPLRHEPRPMLAVNVALGFGRLGLDLDAMCATLATWEVDVHAALVLRMAVFRVHLGWRATYRNALSLASGDWPKVAPGSQGPYAAAGVGW